MAEELIHELAAGYALDALSEAEEREFEAHLAHCPRCQEDVAAFVATAGALAFAAPAEAQPEGLRERILTAARAERRNVVPLRPRRRFRAAAAVAAAAALLAVGFGAGATILHSSGSPTAALRSLRITGAPGSVVVGRGGEAALVLFHLHPAPSGKVYELWVIRGTSARPAGLFSPRGAGTTVVRLSRAVPSGSRVGVTVEPAGGSPHPTSNPIVLSASA